MSQAKAHSKCAPLASIVISTYNRADTLTETLAALARQGIPSESYEVIVVDDGSTDGTPAVLEIVSAPYELRLIRFAENRGVSAGRNAGIRAARGEYLIFLSDDVLVPDDFVAAHVGTLQAWPRSWVVGAFRQLETLRDTPFGRYLDELERSFERARKTRPLGDCLWEMSWPTARNLSLPRADLDVVGLFDERFRTTCEDQDLAQRAVEHGIRFIYNEAIDCLHNDQAADLERYCRFQRRGASDTALLCAKYPEIHGDAVIARVNGPISRSDGLKLVGKKIAKNLVATDAGMRAAVRTVELGERWRAPESWLRRGYRTAIGSAIFRGWREGLRTEAVDDSRQRSDRASNRVGSTSRTSRH